MSHLIFCSFEVGGLPYKMAEILNRHGIRTYYVSLDHGASGHDSAEFHYGRDKEDWDLSPLFDNKEGRHCHTRVLKGIKDKYGIRYCLATGHKSHLLRDAGMDYGYWSYGADFDQFRYTSLWDFWAERRRFIPPKHSPWKKIIIYKDLLWRLKREQKLSINKADSVMLVGYQWETYKSLFPAKKLFYTPHILDIMDYDDLSRIKAQNKKLICEGIGAERFFFSAVRHLWAKRSRRFADYKGNDVILCAFSRYLEISKDRSSKLILMLKGTDVELTKKLIRQLGIDDYVVWKEEMPKKDLLAYYQGASLCFGQFGLPMVSYAVIEPLANASPCVSYIADSGCPSQTPFYNTMPPVFNSRDPEEIAQFIHKMASGSNYAADVSYRSWLWAKENCSEDVFIKSVAELFANSNHG